MTSNGDRCLVQVRHFAKRHNSKTCRQLLRPQPKHDFFNRIGLQRTVARHSVDVRGPLVRQYLLSRAHRAARRHRLYFDALTIDLNVSKPRFNELKSPLRQGITNGSAVRCDRKLAHQLPISIAGLVKHVANIPAVREEHNVRFVTAGQVDEVSIALHRAKVQASGEHPLLLDLLPVLREK